MLLRNWCAVCVLCTAASFAHLSTDARADPAVPTQRDPERATPTSGVPPDPAGVDALRFDVWRIVRAEEASGWLIDELAQRAISADVMASVCAATPSIRQAALESAEAESVALGDPARAFERAGRTLDDHVELVLSAFRRATALRRAVRAAPDQCPFWVTPDPGFRGLQSTRDRFVLSFDTGGLVQLRRSAGVWTLGAGGSGRLLMGYSFTQLSLLAGIEFGGGALLEPESDPTQLLINYLPALPLIARFHRQAWHADVELTPVALFQAADTRLSFGLRGAFTLGMSALRLRGIIPWVGVGLAAEHYLGNAARPRATYLRGGLRVGGVWGP